MFAASIANFILEFIGYLVTMRSSDLPLLRFIAFAGFRRNQWTCWSRNICMSFDMVTFRFLHNETHIMANTCNGSHSRTQSRIHDMYPVRKFISMHNEKERPMVSRDGKTENTKDGSTHLSLVL